MMKYNTELSTATLGENGLTSTAGWLQVYSVEPLNREYVQTSMEYLPVGVGLPAFSYSDKPEQPADGLAIVRSADDLSWETVEDNRGMTVYSTATREPRTVTELGALADDVTLLVPGAYDVWNGKKWVTDEDAQRLAETESARQELTRRLSAADSAIATLQDAVTLEMATEEETQRLELWKKYRVLLSRVDVTAAPDIEWPVAPDAGDQ